MYVNLCPTERSRSLGVTTRVGLSAISFVPLSLHKRMPLLSLTQLIYKYSLNSAVSKSSKHKLIGLRFKASGLAKKQPQIRRFYKLLKRNLC